LTEEDKKHLRIMVPMGGSVIDSETVLVALQMAKQYDGRLYAIHIIEVNRSLPLGAVIDKDVERGERILDEVDQLANEGAQQIETELVQARETGPAIVDEAEEWGADLIVMGLPYKRRFGEFNMGRTVPYVLKNASCRVILFRERRDNR
jgi:nucleotide-binding universal stress UspA family protein